MAKSEWPPKEVKVWPPSITGMSCNALVCLLRSAEEFAKRLNLEIPVRCEHEGHQFGPESLATKDVDGRGKVITVVNCRRCGAVEEREPVRKGRGIKLEY